ncbi:MFS transporter [Luteipulveratus mongoliensis]|uniref:MFS transporter n=1 Tax=Luteipulveratus mongoliensis TaxID=571913 RepID=A0A0K1JGQ2_9MICO|nr:MFS transporter [Luteipulveratus mongoliensis]AKU15894.1 MFS transporter [Luteipulveratus mongoliensis]
MYLSTVRTPRPKTGGGTLRRVVTGNVLALGLVSMVTDVSSEMVTAIMPAYLVLGLHLSMVGYGVVDGLYQGITAVTRLIGGYVADRLRARKLVAGMGYGLSALAKLGLLTVGRSIGGISAMLAVDRIGKGVRTAPRDALISVSAPPDALGAAFGVHRTMDAIGAFLGPLVALLVLSATGQAYDAVFVVSFCIAVLGVILLALFVRERTDTLPTKERPGEPLRAHGTFLEALNLLRDNRFRRIQLAAILLGLVTVGDGFVYLTLQQREDFPVHWFPLLAVGLNLVYLALAGPVGVLADRIGRWRVVLGGHVALLLVYVSLTGGAAGWFAVLIPIALYGVFYAATDGVLMALAGPVLPTHLRTTGIALLQTGQALAYLVSSVAFGAIWQFDSRTHAAWAAAVGVLIALPFSALLLRRAAHQAEVLTTS